MQINEVYTNDLVKASRVMLQRIDNETSNKTNLIQWINNTNKAIDSEYYQILKLTRNSLFLKHQF